MIEQVFLIAFAAVAPMGLVLLNLGLIGPFHYDGREILAFHNP